MVPTDLVFEICRHYIRDNLGHVDTLLMEKAEGYRRSRNIRELSTCSRHFDRLSHSVKDWRFLRQIEAFFKKNALFADKATCRDAAMNSFISSEKQCSDTNRRLRPFMEGEAELSLVDCGYILAAKQYISTVLGPFDLFLAALPELVKVTAGATASTPRRNSLPQRKLSLTLFSTPRAEVYLSALYRFFGFEGFRSKATYANRVELVPKNWKTDRTIACEPEGNLPLQLAFDTYAKRRLRRFHIDLRDQSANKKKAKHASVYGDYVTVDFQAASDTVSYNTVQWLFPEDWFNFLISVRSPCYRGVFGKGTYAKFSSMGNGSTFCIETLLFAAVCHAVGTSTFLVYGDDVIIDEGHFSEFERLAAFLGFTVNLEKTFRDGPFRESCGGDFFDGVDVTPVYIRNIDLRKASLCHLVNTMGYLTFPGSALGDYLCELIALEKLPKVPWNESTLSGVWIDPVEARRRGMLRTRVIRKDGPRLDYFRAYVPKTRLRKFPFYRGYFLWFLYRAAQVAYGGPWEGSARSVSPTQTSSAPVFMHKYTRRLVSWHVPAEATPDHLLWLDKRPSRTPTPPGQGGYSVNNLRR